MTTTVKVEAHCSSDKEVLINVESDVTGEEIRIQDGETWSGSVYDSRSIIVKEVAKDQ